MLKTNLEHMEALKQRIKELEQSNEVFALENEDLRQFSLDGYDIAKNVQALTAEREVLSVDLADKAQVIKRLLDEND
jgi:regulator of replication initiation timing